MTSVGTQAIPQPDSIQSPEGTALETLPASLGDPNVQPGLRTTPSVERMQALASHKPGYETDFLMLPVHWSIKQGDCLPRPLKGLQLISTMYMERHSTLLIIRKRKSKPQ